MTAWSIPAHKLATSTNADLPADFKWGIDLSLGQLIETKSVPIIQWQSPESHVKTNRVGGFRSRFKGRGMDFDESRLYQIGDDIRNIDWRVTARTGEAHTKLFKEERERPVFVVLDLMPSMFFATHRAFKSVIASQIASQLMWNTLANGDRFGTLLFGQDLHLEMKPSSNRRNCMRLLNRIVESHQSLLNQVFGDSIENLNATTPAEDLGAQTNVFANTIKRLQYLAKPGSLIHIISDFNLFDDMSKRSLSKLSQHNDIHMILINDPIERDLPPPGNYAISNGFEEGVINTFHHSSRDGYRKAFNQKRNQIKDFVLSHRGIFTEIDTDLKQHSIATADPARSHDPEESR